MATIQQCAYFSNEVYEGGGGDPGTGWEVYLTSPPNSSGYYGAAYLNRSTGEIVIAHRGTELTDRGDLKSDWQYLVTNSVPGQFSDAQGFYAAILDKIDTDGVQVSSISHTGHSLGGAIARALAVEEDQIAVIFNAPGYVTVPADEDFLNIYAYNAAYDPVSAFGTLVGTV